MVRSYIQLDGALLGVAAGCLGAFIVVSLYSHRSLSHGALVAAMVATSGDEAFVMFSMFPLQALTSKWPRLMLVEYLVTNPLFLFPGPLYNR
jgi:hypothetical protein